MALSVFLPPPAHIYIHSRFLARCSSPCLDTRRPHLPSLTFSSSLAGCAWHFKDSSSPRRQNILFFFSLSPHFFTSRSPRAIFQTVFHSIGRPRLVPTDRGPVRGQMVERGRWVLRPIVAASYRPPLIILREFRHEDAGQKKNSNISFEEPPRFVETRIFNRSL